MSANQKTIWAFKGTSPALRLICPLLMTVSLIRRSPSPWVADPLANQPCASNVLCPAGSLSNPPLAGLAVEWKWMSFTRKIEGEYLGTASTETSESFSFLVNQTTEWKVCKYQCRQRCVKAWPQSLSLTAIMVPAL